MTTTSQVQRGLDLYLYYNGGNFEVPTWNLIDNVKDLTMGMGADEGDSSSRAQEVALAERTLVKPEFSWEMNDIPADTDLQAIGTAYLNIGSTVGIQNPLVIEFAFADGPIATVGTTYQRFECNIFDMSQPQPLAGVSTFSVKAKPCNTGNDVGIEVTVA